MRIVSVISSETLKLALFHGGIFLFFEKKRIKT